jgi:deazaflavin-dependent oxidoreductase (nitroreductase family)
MSLMARFFTQVHAKLFRALGGKTLGGGDADGSVLLLTHTGAKSGKVRDTPLQFVRNGEDVLVVGSFAGKDRNPGWFHNLVANPDAQILINGETRQVRALVATGEERDELWARFVATDDRFGAYETKTARTIPVVILTPR